MMTKDNTLKELLAGVLILGLIEQVLLLIFFEDYLYNAIGLWVGIALMMGLAIHMKRSIEDALGFPEKTAQKYLRSASIKRMSISCIVIGIVLYFDWGNALTILASIFALKLAAYMQPWLHRVFFSKERKSK